MSKLASFVAGFGGGYLKADRQRIEDERQAKLDKMREDEFAMRKEDFAMRKTDAERLRTQQDEIYNDARTKREQSAAITDAVAKANQAGKIENAATVDYVDASGQKKSAYQPDAATAQFAAQQQAMEEGVAMPGTPGSTTSVGKATAVSKLDGGRELFSGMDAAAKAKAYADENQPGSYAGYMSLSKRLAGMAGGQEMADAYLKRAKEAEKEGAFRSLTMLDAGDTEGALKAWNSTGSKRLETGQKFVTVADAAGNKTHQVVDADGKVVVPNVERAMLRYLSGIEGVAKQAEARDNAAAKIREKIYEPKVLKPGEKFGAIDPTDGKWKEYAEGNIPKGYEAMTDAQGNTILRAIDPKGGSGSGSAGKVADPLGDATKAVEFAIDKSAAKGAMDPSAVAQANTIGRLLVATAQSDKRNLDPSMAAEIAINVSTGKYKPVNAFDPRKGTIDSVVEHQGNKFALESFGSPTNSRLPPEQMSSIAMGFINQVAPEQRSVLVPAAYNPQARAKLDAQVESRVRAPEAVAALEARLGRKPNEDDIKQAVAAAKSAMQPQLELISRWATRTPDGQEFIKKTLKDSGYSPDGKAELAKPPAVAPGASGPAIAQRMQQTGGLYQRPTLAERQQAIQAAKDRAATAEAEAQRTAVADAQRLLQGNDVNALARFQASSGFDRLDKATKTAIYNKVNGIR